MRRYPDRPLVGVGAVIVEDGRILLVKRKNEPNRGKWSIPGGLVRKGERIKDALKREIREELGVDITIGDVACVTDEIIRDENGDVEYHYVIIDFYGSIKGKPKPMSDAEEARWFELDEVENINAVDFVKKLVRIIKSGKSQFFID